MNLEQSPTVYMLASRRNGTLYLGVTSDLVGRIYQHREGLIPGFTQKYGVKRLVWFETHEAMEFAIQREKRIKKWRRAWKLELIEKANPDWDDLAENLGFEPLS
ncbi:GIY-YIG nuclease family protein [Erythrobacter sp. HA6-11]